MSDNPQVKLRRRNSPQDREQDGPQKQDNRFTKIQRNDLHEYVQQPKIKRNRDEQIEDSYDEDDDENSAEKFGGFVFTKNKTDQKKTYVYEPKAKQQQQYQKKEYVPKKDQPQKKRPEKKNNKAPQAQQQQQKEPSKQQLSELEKLQQHLMSCGIPLTPNQDNQDSEMLLPQDFNRLLTISSPPMVGPPPGLANEDKSADFADLLKKLHDEDSDGQMNYDQHFSSSVLTGGFPLPQPLTQPKQNQNIPINQINTINQDLKNKEKKKKNKKKKPKKQNDLNLINNPPDFSQHQNESYDPFKATPFSYPQQQSFMRNNLPDPLSMQGPAFSTPLGLPPPGMMGFGPQIAPFNSNLLGAPQQLGFPPGPNIGMDQMDPTFPMGPSLGGLNMNSLMGPMNPMNPMNMNPMNPMNPMMSSQPYPPMPKMPRQGQQQGKKHQNKQNMMMPPPNQFDNPAFCPTIMPPMQSSMGQPPMPMGQPFAPNLMSQGPILGMPPMMQFDNNYDNDWMAQDGMLQLPTPMQVFQNQNFPNLSQVQHPDNYLQDGEQFMAPVNLNNQQKYSYDGDINTQPQNKTRKKLNLNSKPFEPKI